MSVKNKWSNDIISTRDIYTIPGFTHSGRKWCVYKWPINFHLSLVPFHSVVSASFLQTTFRLPLFILLYSLFPTRSPSFISFPPH